MGVQAAQHQYQIVRALCRLPLSLSTGNACPNLGFGLDNIYFCRFLSPAIQVTGGRDGCVRVWDPRVSEPVVRVEPREGEVKTTASVSPFLVTNGIVTTSLCLYGLRLLTIGLSPDVESVRLGKSSSIPYTAHVSTLVLSPRISYLRLLFHSTYHIYRHNLYRSYRCLFALTPSPGAGRSRLLDGYLRKRVLRRGPLLGCRLRQRRREAVRSQDADHALGDKCEERGDRAGVRPE